jgi:dUTP pyrophosphatase
MNTPILVKRLPHAYGLPAPSYATAGAAGMDIIAAGRVTVYVGQTALIPTGLCVSIPPGHELQIRPRSGLALKHRIIVANSPGTIDEDYRGEIGVILLNLGDDTFIVNRGDRIAQAVLAPVIRGELIEVPELDKTARGEGGFGSTGVAAA